jgi:hypothetical protein
MEQIKNIDKPALTTLRRHPAQKMVAAAGVEPARAMPEAF